MEKRVLYRFFEGTATSEEEAAVRRWLEKDPANRIILLNERKLFDALLLLSPSGMTDDE